jgi:H+/citrate symporter
MLTILGFTMIATFLVLIMLKKMSPIAALVLIPALFCVFVGKGAKLGDYVIDGVTSLAPTAAMLMFAIVYFGVMIDVGLFDPISGGSSSSARPTRCESWSARRSSPRSSPSTATARPPS